MLRAVSVVVPLIFVLTACGPTVYRPSPEEVQQEQERLTARSKEYYRQQKERVERIGKQLLAQVPNPPSVEFKENAPASAPVAKQGMADEESDDPGPASLPSTPRPELHAKAVPSPHVTLRTLYDELRAGRISQEEYETKKRELLNGSE